MAGWQGARSVVLWTPECLAVRRARQPGLGVEGQLERAGLRPGMRRRAACLPGKGSREKPRAGWERGLRGGLVVSVPKLVSSLTVGVTMWLSQPEAPVPL